MALERKKIIPNENAQFLQLASGIQQIQAQQGQQIKGLENEIHGLRESIGSIDRKLSEIAQASGQPLWRFATILVSIIAVVGGLIVKGANDKINHIHTEVKDNKDTYDAQIAFFQGELVKSVEQRARLDEKATTMVNSLTHMDTVLQREMGLKDDTIREEMNHRFDGSEKQFELLSLRMNELATRLFNLVGNSFPPIQHHKTNGPTE